MTTVPAAPELTERHHQVLILIAEGLMYREIGKRLWLHPASVRNAAHFMRKRLGAKNNAEAVAIGHKLRYLPGVVVTRK